MKYIKTYENNDEKYILTVVNRDTINTLNICVNATMPGSISKYIFDSLEKATIDDVYYFTLEEIEIAKQYMKKFLGDLYEYYIFEPITKENFLLMLDMTKYNI